MPSPRLCALGPFVVIISGEEKLKMWLILLCACLNDAKFFELRLSRSPPSGGQ